MDQRGLAGAPGNERVHKPRKLFLRDSRGERKPQARASFGNGGRPNAADRETFALEMLGRIECGVVVTEDYRNNLAGGASGVETLGLQRRAKICRAMEESRAICVHSLS